MEYKIGDHVIIENSNIDWLVNFAGKFGTIVGVYGFKEFQYNVFPDEWGEIVEGQGVWSNVKCLVKDVDSKYLNCKFVLVDVPYDARYCLTEGKIYTMTNGRFEHDQGTKWPFDDPIENEADLVAYFNGSRFEVSRKEQCSSYDSAQVIIIKED